ncbi:MAG: metallophosphoesterase [Ignavibacteriales bacterium]|nr:metallophosphoesterase [Ignavibacteriales bacterium]
MKLVHTADWHWSELQLEKCVASARFIIEQLGLIKPDLHVLAGDYWDHRQMLSSSSAVHPALAAMRAMANISPVAIVLGNSMHDAPGSLEIFRGLDSRFPIVVAERPATVVLCRDEKGGTIFRQCPEDDSRSSAFDQALAIVHLFPYPNKSFWLSGKPAVSIDEATCSIQRAIESVIMRFAAVGHGFRGPKVMVGHCLVSGAQTSSGQILSGQEIAIGKSEIALAGADYYALGHIHRSQEISDCMWYAGSTHHVNFGETETKSFNVVEFGSGGATVKVVEIPSRRMALHEAHFDAATSEVIDENPAEDWFDAELRVRIYLRPEQTSVITDDEIRKRYPGAYSYKIERLVIPEERVRTEMIIKATTLREKMLEWARTVEKQLSPGVLVLADEVEQTDHPNPKEPL